MRQWHVVIFGVAILALAAQPGCVKLSSQVPVPAPPAVAPAPARPAPPPAPIKSQAYEGFNQFRGDLLKAYPSLGKTNCAVAVGVDVSGSSHATGILEYTTKLLTDACRYFFVPGDRIAIIPWDSRVRQTHVKTFDYSDTEQAVDDLNASFENLENLVDPESKGSNLLDARGSCMEQALKLANDSGGKLSPVVLIFTDIRVPDLDFSKPQYAPDKLLALRVKLAGKDAEFLVKAYQAGEKRQVITHALAGSGKSAAPASVDRMRKPASVSQARPVAATPPPRAPRDMSGFRALFIVLAILAFVGLIGLPLSWRHKLSVGETRENIRAFGGRVVVQSGRGISPRGTVYLPIPDLEDRPLFAIEGKGPQIVAVARRGVRMNDGRTELTIPIGRPVTLRIAIDGVPGEQSLDVQVTDFFATNTGSIIGMILAFILVVACIIG